MEMERTHSYRENTNVKSFAIPNFMSKASLIYVSKDLIQAVNKELYSFIWKGKDEVKRLALTNGIENGGLKMLDIESMVLAQRTTSVPGSVS